mgnify:CR=1 FL=1
MNKQRTIDLVICVKKNIINRYVGGHLLFELFLSYINRIQAKKRKCLRQMN